MSKFYSSLVICSKNFPTVHQVLKPRYNKEYFKRVTANASQLKIQIGKRCKYNHSINIDSLDGLRDKSKELVKLKERLDKVKDDNVVGKIVNELEAIEDQIMPTVVALPNRSSKFVPTQDIIVDEIKSDFLNRQNLHKVLSHRRLAYLNNCYSKSVVGPNSHYYFGIGAKLQHGLREYFTSELQEENFVPVSGLCLVKSAIVEASNSDDCKSYFTDPARTLSDEHSYTTLHLTETSRESLTGFLTTLGKYTTNEPFRFMSSGAAYRAGRDWFDGDDKRITQFETIHAMILNSSIEQYSLSEYIKVKDIIWNIYKKLELPVRLIHCSIESMLANEYDAHRVDIWLPSRQDWIQVGRISHYRDHISIRAGMKRGHLIDSMVYDGQVLAAAIIENRQTNTGKFVIPVPIQKHVMHLSQQDKLSYFANSNLIEGEAVSNGFTKPVMLNYEQRRYIAKRNYLFAHGKKAYKAKQRKHNFRELRIALAYMMFLYFLIDWKEFWISYLPDSVRRLFYDYVYRPSRRLYRWVAFGSDGAKFIDLSYDELDKTEYEMTSSERKKARFDKVRKGDFPHSKS